MDSRIETIGRVMALIEAGGHADAMALIAAAIGDNPGDLAFHLLKSEALRKIGDLPAAEAILVAIHRDAPDNADVLYRIGMTRLHQGDLPGAAEAFELACRLAGDNHLYFSLLGRTLMQLGRHAEAEPALLRAIELDPHSIPDLLSLAFCLSRPQIADAALHGQEDSLLNDPLQETLAESVLQFYLEKSLYPAARHLTKAMALAMPHTAYWPGMLGGIVNALGAYAEAEGYCRRAVALQPDSALFTCHLGASLRQSGRIPAAIDALRRSIQLQPDFADSNMTLANLYLDAARFDDAYQVVADYDVRVGYSPTVKRSVVIAVLDYSPGSPFNIRTLLDNLQSFDGEVICVFNDRRVFEELQNHPRIDKFSFNKHNVGVSRGWNIGINQAEGETIHILNADLRISPEMLYRMEHWVQTLPDALCVGITAHWMDFSTLKETRFLNTGTYTEPLETDAVSGQLLTLHAARLHDAGISFDPRLAPYFGEETDLALKIRKAGYKVYAVPETDFEHPWGISRQDRPIQCLGRPVNRMRCIVRNKVLLKRKIDAYLDELKKS